MSLKYPHRNMSSGMISGERGGHRTGPSRPTHCPEKCVSRNSRIIRAQCWGMRHLAGTSHFADGLPTGVTDTTIACPDNHAVYKNYIFRVMLDGGCRTCGKRTTFIVLFLPPPPVQMAEILELALGSHNVQLLPIHKSSVQPIMKHCLLRIIAVSLRMRAT
jgi:hypothetical protein